MRARAWYDEAARRLAGGATIKEAAAAVRVAEKTIRRHLKAPSSVLASMVEKERAAVASGVADELAPLRGKALAVLERALDGGDVGAAKALLTKLVAGPADLPPEPAAPAEEVTPEAAVREVAASLPAVADLAGAGLLPADAVEELRGACRAFLADGLRPRMPLDLEAERVDMISANEPGAGGVR